MPIWKGMWYMIPTTWHFKKTILYRGYNDLWWQGWGRKYRARQGKHSAEQNGGTGQHGLSKDRGYPPPRETLGWTIDFGWWCAKVGSSIRTTTLLCCGMLITGRVYTCRGRGVWEISLKLFYKKIMARQVLQMLHLLRQRHGRSPLVRHVLFCWLNTGLASGYHCDYSSLHSRESVDFCSQILASSPTVGFWLSHNFIDTFAP